MARIQFKTNVALSKANCTGTDAEWRRSAEVLKPVLPKGSVIFLIVAQHLLPIASIFLVSFTPIILLSLQFDQQESIQDRAIKEQFR